jgi:phospholipase/carboxylesterase
VPAANETELLTFNNWTLRVRASQSASPRLLVLIHGWTGDENSMWVFTRNLSTDYWMMAPRAPHAGDPSGFSWRPPEMQTLRHSFASQGGAFGRPGFESLEPAAGELMRLIDEYSASVKLDAKSFDLMGFSQGAAMVNVIGMLHPQRVRKMAVLAGFVPSDMETIVQQKPLAGKNIFMAHGTQDQMVPVERARASVEMLEKAGAQVTYCEDEVGHKLGATCMRALENYLKD